MCHAPESSVRSAAPGTHRRGTLGDLVTEAFSERWDDRSDLSGLMPYRSRKVGGALERVRTAITANAIERSLREFEEFSFELQRQLRAEADVIFRELDLLEAASRDRAALILWLEHEEIRMNLDSIRHAFNDGEIPREGIEGLQRLLSAHKVREELLLCSRLELEDEPEAARRILRGLELCLAW